MDTDGWKYDGCFHYTGEGQVCSVEAKGSTTWESIRMALGQILDYRRSVPDPECAILVSSSPRSDLLQLAASARVAVI